MTRTERLFLRAQRAALAKGMDTPAGVARYDRIMGAWRAWLWRPSAPTCEYCGEPKQAGTVCRGNDECIYGPDGGKAMCCAGWAGMCCKCGASYAIGQM